MSYEFVKMIILMIILTDKKCTVCGNTKYSDYWFLNTEFSVLGLTEKKLCSCKKQSKHFFCCINILELYWLLNQ